MKKALQIICAVAVITLMGSCGNKNQYVINGTVADMNGMTVYLVCDGKDAPVDSAIVADGTFTFTGTVEEPWSAGLLTYNGPIAELIVEPGNIVVKGDSIGGTPLNDKLQVFISGLNMKEIRSTMEEHIPLYYSATSAEERAKEEHYIDSLKAVLNARMLDASWNLYHENSDNILCLMAMRAISQVGTFTYREFDSIMKTANPMVSGDDDMVRKLEQLRAIEATSAGKHYTDIQGVNGKLSDLIDGKLALVDFYASWCGPCRNEIKDNLVPLWKKYQSKGLVIVGLNVWERGDAEARKAAHEKVMAELGITYPQLVDSTHTATETYGVTSIPQIMLIAPDGTILARDLRGAAIEEAIVEALQK